MRPNTRGDKVSSQIKRILIVGAGMAGLTLAIALRRQGITPDIVERQPAWPVHGAGIYLLGNAMRALDSLRDPLGHEGVSPGSVAVNQGFLILLCAVLEKEGSLPRILASSWREGGISRNLAPDSWRRPKHIVSITQDGCFFVFLQQICLRLSCAMIL